MKSGKLLVMSGFDSKKYGHVGKQGTPLLKMIIKEVVRVKSGAIRKWESR